MRGTPVRVARLAVAAGVAAVMTAGAAPAFADSTIPYYAGSASGQAVALQVNPHAVLDANLPALKTIIDGLPLGAGQLINGTVGSTLKDPAAPITVTIDSSTAKGLAAKGTELTDGAASSTAVAIDAKSLQTELDMLKSALTNLPSGTVAALEQKLQPVIAADPTGLGAQLKSLLGVDALVNPVSDTLGNPSINVLQAVNANFGERVQGDLTKVNAGLLTKQALSLQPFEARALPADAYASNAVDNLSLVPTGAIGVVNQDQLKQALTLVQGTLIQLENKITSSTSSVLPGTVNSVLTGTVLPAVNGVVSPTGPVSQATATQLNAINDLINQVALLRSLLGGLNGLQLNQVVGNNGANSVSSLSRTGDKVTATGLGNVAHVDVVKVNDPALQTLLGSVGGTPVLELASVDGVKGSTSVTLDGVHPAQQAANGQLVDIKLLGQSLSHFASLAGQNVSLDEILPAGTTCQVNIPGTSTCHGIKLLVPLTDKLAALNTVTDQLPTLVNVTLTRGLGVVDQTNSLKYGRADITTLQLTSDLNCSAVQKYAGALNSVGTKLDLGLNIAACGVGVGNVTPTSANNARSPKAVDATENGGTAHLVNLSMGVAHAEVNLTPGSTPVTNDSTGPVPPTTGNNLLILAGVALAAVAGGVALQIRKARA